MPTGYTYIIEKNVSFKEFASNCATAFCYQLRDMSNPILPDSFELDTYHLQELQSAKKKLEEYSNMSIEEASKLAKEVYDNSLAEYNKIICEKNELKLKYESMLSNVNEWIPPSLDHNAFKEFMVEQLQTSIKCDCRIDYYNRELNEHKLMSGEEYKNMLIDIAKDDIKYHQTEYDKDVANNIEQNTWIKLLKDSLK